MRKISDSTVRRLSVYLRFLEQAKAPPSLRRAGPAGGTTSAQVRKDLSFFGSFGKRPRYAVPELTRASDILGLERATGRAGRADEWRRSCSITLSPAGFHITAIYDQDARKIGSRWNAWSCATSSISKRPQERPERHRHRRDARRVGATVVDRLCGAREGHPQLAPCH